MCLPSSSSSTPPPPPPLERPEPAPKRTDQGVKRARTTQRQVAAAAQGRSSTILGGQISEPARTTRKTLLGA